MAKLLEKNFILIKIIRHYLKMNLIAFKPFYTLLKCNLEFFYKFLLAVSTL